MIFFLTAKLLLQMFEDYEYEFVELQHQIGSLSIEEYGWFPGILKSNGNNGELYTIVEPPVFLQISQNFQSILSKDTY
jgi:hypothetical protein